MTEEFDLERGNWMSWFLSMKGHEIFSEIDEEYALDKFNLTGLMLNDPTYFQDALALITDTFDEHEKLYREFEKDRQRRNRVIATALQMYGLIHARYILTTAGMKKMQHKFQHAQFGKCPRTFCHKQALLPCGLHDMPHTSGLKLFCPKCEDLYEPMDARHQFIDGAWFGSTFAHLFLLSFKDYTPEKPEEVYIPKLFGFKLHSTSQLYTYRNLGSTPVGDIKNPLVLNHHRWNPSNERTCVLTKQEEVTHSSRRRPSPNTVV